MFFFFFFFFNFFSSFYHRKKYESGFNTRLLLEQLRDRVRFAGGEYLRE